MPKNLSCLSRRIKVVPFSNSKKSYLLNTSRTKAIICILSASVSTCTSTSSNPINIMSSKTDAAMMSGNDYSKILWDGSDKNGFASLDHPGYSTESNCENFTGGWHAHRKVWEESDDDQPNDCWIKEIFEDVSKFDYQSMEIGRPPRILVLYGSLRPTSFSRKCGMFFFLLFTRKHCTVHFTFNVDRGPQWASLYPFFFFESWIKLCC